MHHCRVQYIGKSKTQFNVRLNNHRSDVDRHDAPQADQHTCLTLLRWRSLPYRNQ